MMLLEERIAEQLPEWRERVNRLRNEFGDFKVSDVTVSQIYGGIRGVQIQVSDISYVDPIEGIRIRGYSIPELLKTLPKLPGAEFPLAGGVYYLLLTDQLPTFEDAMIVEEEWRQRSLIPTYVYNTIRRMPKETHPMTLFSIGIMALQKESVFAKEYEIGVVKDDHWRYFCQV